MPRQPYPSPRVWLVDGAESQFGRKKDADWDEAAPQTSLDRALLAAAQNQHRLARTIRIQGEAEGLKTPDLAAAVDISAPTLRAILYGRNHADIAILYALASAVGLDARASLHLPRSGSAPPAEGTPTGVA